MARLPGARPEALTSTTMQGVLISGVSYVVGWSFRESTGAAGAQIDLYNGTSTSGMLAASIALNAGESTRDLIPSPGIEFTVGLYVNVASGAVVGSIWILPATIYNEYALVEGDVPVDSYRS